MKHLVILAFALSLIVPLNAQPKRIDEYISEATFYFSIDSFLSEEGHALFDRVFEDHRFVILGEYHRSSQIGRLTEVLLPLYRKHGGNLFGLEIGPNAAQILDDGLEAQRALPLLRAINTEYGIRSEQRAFTPLPFFSNLEDARFLQVAKDQGLELVGFDYEFIYSYPFLLDKLAAILSKTETAEQSLRTLSALRDSISIFQGYDIDFKNGARSKKYRLPILIQESRFVKKSFEQLATTSTRAERLINAIKTSNEIYYHHATGNWWTSNEQRTQNFVSNFRDKFIEDGTLSAEKLFLKIGGLHAARGLNGYNKYDIGNLIYETARLLNEKSCHIVVLDRFWFEDDQVSDVLSDTSSWYGNNFGQLLAVADSTKWSVIDLGKIRKQGLYHPKINDRVREYFARYDLVLIPPADREPTLNVEQE